MKTTLITLQLFLAFILLPPAVYCQGIKPTYKIQGIVADSANQQILEFVTLIVKDDSNKTIRADYSKTDGSFTFSGLQAGNYAIALTLVGYKSKEIRLVIADSASLDKNLGFIYLSNQAIGLTEVVVKAGKSIITQEIDRIAYDLQLDPDSKVYSALEMMRKVPFLSLDADENILLKGNSNYWIFINGKPSGMVERNPKDVLKNMPASTIERIEVITNPSAKYDAEGTAGIINIITTTKPGSGYKGSVSISHRFPAGGPGIGSSVSAQMGKLGMSAFGGLSANNTPLTNNSLNRVTNTINPTSLIQTGNTLARKRNAYFGYELSYEINKQQLVSGQFNINSNTNVRTIQQQSLLTNQGIVLQGYGLDNKGSGTGKGVDAALNYQLGFKTNKDKLLTFSYRYYGYVDTENDNIDLLNKFNYEYPDYQQYNNQRFSEQSFQIDYVHPMRKLTMEAGLKTILRKNDSQFELSTLNVENGSFELNPDLSNQFNYNQKVFSGYNTYQYNLNNWSIKVGARIEGTFIDADFISTHSTVNQQYTNLIPSFALSRKLRNNSNLTLGMVQRIARPSIRRLNPFVDRSNPNVEISGNPNLRPYTFNRIQLGYGFSKKASINMGLDFTFVRNIDFITTVYDSVTNITRSTYENTGRGSGLDYLFNMRYPINKKWDLNLNSIITYLWAVGGSGQSRVKTAIFQYNATVSTGYRFNKGWRMNGSLTIISRSFKSPQEKANGLFGSSISVTKDLIADKLSFSALLANPFTKYRNNLVDTISPEFTQVRSSYEYFRSFNMSLNYNFGRMKADIKKNKRGIKNDDL